MIDRISRALGRIDVPRGVPEPPAIDPRITRLVRADADPLPRFLRMAEANRMFVQLVARESLGASVTEALRRHECLRVAVAIAGAQFSAEGGIEFTSADRIWPDELYAFDASVTPVDFAVAETGSIVIRGTATHPRTLSLVPRVHIAIVEATQIVPDLVDLLESASSGSLDNSVIITGPSKTADIEGHLVTGVHGPGVVHLFIVQ
jgi:L-lactate utilization protein LutC